MPTKKKKADPANGISLEKAKQKKNQKDVAGFPIIGMGASADQGNYDDDFVKIPK